MTGTAEPPATRLVRALTADDNAGAYRYHGQAGDGSGYVVETTRHRRVYPLDGMQAWHDGYTIGRQLAEQPRPAGDADQLADIRSVLVTPSLEDQCRMQIRYAMEQAGIGVVKLAERTGRTRGAIAAALRFGRAGSLSLKMADQMMAGLGRRWDVRSVPAVDREGAPVAPPAHAPPEPAGITRVRAVALAHERGLVELLAPLDATEAARARAYRLRAAGAEHTIRAPVVLPWLTGIADAADPATAADLTEPNTAHR